MNKYIWIFNCFCDNMCKYIVVNGDFEKAKEYINNNYKITDFARTEYNYERGMKLVEKYKLILLEEVTV